MSLLKWKEIAKSKSKLGDKINYVHNEITKHKIGQETSQESFDKVFKPVTTKLDDVITSNLNLRTPQRRKRPPEKVEPGIDYMPEVDPYEDMDVEGLINFGDYVAPQQEKQLVPKPPTYEESLEDILEGKKIYVDPQYFPQNPQYFPQNPQYFPQNPQYFPQDPQYFPQDPQYFPQNPQYFSQNPQYFSQNPQELPPEYDDDVDVDYTMDDEDISKDILNDIGITNYENVEKILNQPEMNPTKTKAYLNKIIKEAVYKRNQLNGFKANITKQYKSGKISEADRQMQNKRIDNARVTLNGYINHYNTKLQTGTGIRGRGRKQRGGNVMFFNDVNQLLKKLELIIGEVLAGNTSIKMRNTGVAILDTLLRMSTINRPQYNKLYNKYFKV